MQKLIWLAVGVLVGYVAATYRPADPSPEGVLADLRTRAREFGDTVRRSYLDRQDELRDALRDN